MLSSSSPFVLPSSQVHKKTIFFCAALLCLIPGSAPASEGRERGDGIALKEHMMPAFNVAVAPTKLVVIKNVLVEEVGRCSVYP
jgi:hypothetical protein